VGQKPVSARCQWFRIVLDGLASKTIYVTYIVLPQERCNPAASSLSSRR